MTDRPSPRSGRADRGSATLLSLAIAAVLLAACVIGVMWAAVSVAHHRADTAADLAALSAAQAQQSNPSQACATAARITATQGVSLKYCHAEADTITVAVTVKLHLGIFGTPLVTSEARAGPIEGADWPGDG